MKKLTPQATWDQYVDMPVKMFVSLSHYQNITDMKQMCQRYAQDIPYLFERPFDQEFLEQIAKLIEQHIVDIGYEEQDLYTKEQIDEMHDRDVEQIRSYLKKFV